MDICVIGAGYVGLTTAVCFAELGHNIRIIDLDKEKIDKIRRGISPIYEENMKELLLKNKKRINVSTVYDFTEKIVFICVGTPSNKNGTINLKYIKKAVNSVAKNAEGGTLIVIKSTVYPSTTEKIIKPLIDKYCKNCMVAMNPEFLREGKAIYDFLNPDRIIIGTTEKKAKETLKKLYNNVDAPVFITTPTEAEMIKYASNALLATKISFANEFGNLCKILDIDSYNVMKGVGMDKRISSSFLDSGIGFGGSCFPKDLRAIYYGSKKIDYNMELIKSVLNVNEKQPFKIIETLKKHTDLKGKVIAILGLSFKPDTDDIRESKAIPIIQQLKMEGAIVKAHDPMATKNMKKIIPDIVYSNSIADALKNADACLILTDWKEYRNIDFSNMKGKIVIEGRRTLKNKRGIIHEGITW